MTASADIAATRGTSGGQAILWAGILAGTMDIVAAIVVNLSRISPLTVLQSVASGLLGRESYAGGIATGMLGLALHFAIMFVIAAIFYFASRRLAFMTRRWVLTGVLFGMAVHLFMKFVVLPLSAFPHPMNLSVESFAINFAIQITCVGLPIAFVVRHFSR